MEIITVILGFISVYLILLLVKFGEWLSKLPQWIGLYWINGLVWGVGAILCIVTCFKLRRHINTWRSTHPPSSADLNPSIKHILQLGAVLLLLYCLYEAYAIYATMQMLLGDNPMELQWRPWDYASAMIQLLLSIVGAIALLRLQTSAVILFAVVAVIYFTGLIYGISRNPAYLGQLATIMLFATIKVGLPLSLAIFGLRKGYLRD